MRPTLWRFADEAGWTGRILSDFEAAVRAAIGRGQDAFHASLAGGNTPEPAYWAIAAAPSLASLSGQILIHFWVGDERDVPADSPLRNGRMIASVFGEGAVATATAVAWKRPPILHLWPEGGREKACALYARELIASMGDQPVFDLAILGMGADGHTAGLFSMAETDPDLLTIPTTALFEPTSRMTMGASLLKASRRSMIFVRGRDKLKTLEAVLDGGAFPLDRVIGTGSVFYYLE